MNRKLILGIGVVILSGWFGGVRLGNYATGDIVSDYTAPDEFAYADVSYQSAAVEALSAQDASTVAAAKGPDHYSCTGCGPSLEERRMQALYDESYHAGDYPGDYAAGVGYADDYGQGGAAPSYEAPLYEAPAEEAFPSVPVTGAMRDGTGGAGRPHYLLPRAGATFD